MGFFSKDISTMDDLFVHMLGDIYYAEQEIVKALPTMMEKATDSQLRSGLAQHLAETPITFAAWRRCLRCTASNLRRSIPLPSTAS